MGLPDIKRKDFHFKKGHESLKDKFESVRNKSPD